MLPTAVASNPEALALAPTAVVRMFCALAESPTATPLAEVARALVPSAVERSPAAFAWKPFCVMKSLSFDAHDSTAYENLGVLELNAGNRALAAKYFAEALWLVPDSQTARQGLSQSKR